MSLNGDGLREMAARLESEIHAARRRLDDWSEQHKTAAEYAAKLQSRVDESNDELERLQRALKMVKPDGDTHLFYARREGDE